MSESNNLFDWANKELAQDSFICWLLAHIGLPAESAEKRIALKLVAALTGDETFASQGTVRIYKQRYWVDILLTVNDDGPREERRALMIEDKVTADLYNDLEGYREAICAENAFNLPVENVHCAVIKTAEDGDLQWLLEQRKGSFKPRLLSRQKLLNILTSEPSSSEILNDFIAHLQTVDEHYTVWKRKPYKEWIASGKYAWMGYQGLFSALLKHETGFERWFYVNNPTAPFNCLWMEAEWITINLQRGPTEASFYFHLNSSTQELQLKLGDLDKAYCSEMRDTVINRIEALREKGMLPLLLSNMQPPKRLGHGCYVTLKNIPALPTEGYGWLILDADGKVNLEATAKRLKAFSEIIPALAKLICKVASL